MADAVRHINLIDGEQVYCHREGKLVTLDGPHLAEYCWSCPFWAGMAGGYGVECMYLDENVGGNRAEVRFSKPEDALNAAPDVPNDLEAIASDDGIMCRDARVALNPDDSKLDEVNNETVPPTQEQAEQGVPPKLASVSAAAEQALQDLLRGKL